MSGSSGGDLLARLAPPVRPDGVQGSATTSAGRIPFEARGFADLLTEAQAWRGQAQPGEASAQDEADPSPGRALLERLGSIDRTENAGVIRVRTGATP